MSFYRRYSGIQPPVVPVTRGTASAPMATKAGSIMPAAPAIFPTTPKEVLSFTPVQPTRSYAPPLFNNGTAASFLPPGSIAATAVQQNPMTPNGAQAVFDHPAIRRAAASDQKATDAAQNSKNATQNANVAVFNASQAAAKAQMDPNAAAESEQAVKAAAQAQRQAAVAAAAADAANAKAQVDAAAAQQVIDQGSATPTNDGGSVTYDNSGGADPGADISEALPPIATVDPVTGVITPVSTGPSLLAIGGAAAGGFVAGGPLGALVGAAVGYFLSKPATPARGSAQVSRYRGFYRR